VASNELIFDSWTAMSFKRALGGKQQPGLSWAAPSWVGDHERRLLAYKVLQSYADNSARVFLSTTDQNVIDQHREYGDASLIVNQIVAALLGETQDIVVPEADDYDPEGDDTTGATPAEQSSTSAKQAFELQEWLRSWAEAERLPLKMIETERNAVGLGDGVYVLGWNAEKQRARLRVFDPGFYFPVLNDGNEDDFPEKVHLAWEMEAEEGKRRVRRITWELGPISPANRQSLLDRLRREDPVPLDGDVLDAETGQLTRQLPWNEKPTSVTCYLTDAIWTVDLTGPANVNDMTGASAEYLSDADGEINQRDLRIDFIPVVHVPNTVSIANHYGRSSLAAILQILDDLSNADTDLQAASSTTGKPVIALSGATFGATKPTYRAGEIFEVGDGRMDVMDTSKALDALIKYVEFLLSRLSVNARLPESVLGRISPSEVPSGVALALSFGPLASMVGEMRLVRQEKYPLLLKMAHRLAVAGQAPDVPQEFLPAQVELGSFLPQDQTAAVTTVTSLLEKKAISLETGVRILMAAGLPIEDAAEEVRRIEARDFSGADQLLSATGDEDAVFEYLDREKPAAATPPTVIPPNTPVLPVPQPPG
jgi:hypothetical protein